VRARTCFEPRAVDWLMSTDLNAVHAWRRLASPSPPTKRSPQPGPRWPRTWVGRAPAAIKLGWNSLEFRCHRTLEGRLELGRWCRHSSAASIWSTFPFAKQAFGWTTRKFRTPEAADRWTWILIVAHPPNSGSPGPPPALGDTSPARPVFPNPEEQAHDSQPAPRTNTGHAATMSAEPSNAP
jgi:hypothetical protein